VQLPVWAAELLSANSLFVPNVLAPFPANTKTTLES